MQSIDHTLFESSAQRELDKQLLVKFFNKQRPDTAKTLEAGRPMFKDVIYVDIKVAGSRNGGACRPARPDDIARFQPHYDAFKNRTEAPTEGTPLAEWALVTRSTVEELAYQNVKTVEQLSTMSDTHVAKMLGLSSLKAKAIKWLESAGETARLNQLEALENDNKSKDERINKLEKMVADLMVKMETPEPDSEIKAVKKTPTRSRRRNALKPE